MIQTCYYIPHWDQTKWVCFRFYTPSLLIDVHITRLSNAKQHLGEAWQQIHVARKKLGSANEMLFIREHY